MPIYSKIDVAFIPNQCFCGMGFMFILVLNRKSLGSKIAEIKYNSIEAAVQYGVKVLIRLQTSSMQPLKFGNRQVISYRTLLWM